MRATLPMPAAISVQVGTGALVASLVTDDFWEWLGVVGAMLAGWVGLFLVLLAATKARRS